MKLMEGHTYRWKYEGSVADFVFLGGQSSGWGGQRCVAVVKNIHSRGSFFRWHRPGEIVSGLAMDYFCAEIEEPNDILKKMLCG